MSIHEERDIVLNKIHELSQRDQVVSRSLVVKELEGEYQLSQERTESAIWYLIDFRYIIRDQENRDHIRLTPRGNSLIGEGGFVLRRLNNRRDLRKAIDELSHNLSQLEERIAALEEPSEPEEMPVTTQEQKPSFSWWWVALIVALVAVLVLLYLYGPARNDYY